MNKRSTRWRWLLDLSGLVVCVGATVLFYFGGIDPLLRGRADFRGYQAALNAQRKIASDLAAQQRGLEADLDKARQVLADSPVQLQSCGDINQRIASLAGLASHSGLKLDEVRPGSPTSGIRYATVPIHLTGTGNYPTCVALLHAMRQSFPDITVTALEMSGNPTDPRGIARFNVDLLWYAAATAQARGNR